jgi:hypothetical protein
MSTTVVEATKELKKAIAAFKAVSATNPDREKLEAARNALDDAIVATFRDLEGDIEGAKVSKDARDLLRQADDKLASKGGRRRRGRKTRGRKTRGRRHTRHTRSTRTLAARRR